MHVLPQDSLTERRLLWKSLTGLPDREYELRELGFSQFRIRSHENLARLEFIPAEIDRAWILKEKLTEICKRSGFSYVTIDLVGYRSGSMNEVLTESEKKSNESDLSGNFERAKKSITVFQEFKC